MYEHSARGTVCMNTLSARGTVCMNTLLEALYV